jgi:hypothetical protein
VSAPVRGIKAKTVSASGQPGARRAIVEVAAPESGSEGSATQLVMPGFGPAERQLIWSYVATGVVVLFLLVALPAILGMVRNF